VPLVIVTYQTNQTGPRCYRDFAVEMAENRSNIPSAARILVLLWALAAGLIGIAAILAGAWLIGLFELGMLAALGSAFSITGRRPRRCEWLVFDGGLASHRLRRNNGSIEEWSAPRAFVRFVEIAGPACGSLYLCSGHARRAIGGCLNERERAELSALLRRVLPA
jgi:uncharacterized membrane protein